nr:bile acid:sodium symporter [Jiella pacifica]
MGFLYLAVLPSAVSSSIAFTAMAKGNVSAAICNSAGSNVFGLMLTPLLAMILMQHLPSLIRSAHFGTSCSNFCCRSSRASSPVLGSRASSSVTRSGCTSTTSW